MVWFLVFIAVAVLIGILRSNRMREYFSAEGWSTPLSRREQDTLSRNFEFYRSLPSRSKRIFEYRVNRFRELTEFVPREMATITDEMEILISASAIQLTFGFDDVLLSHFERVIVYPDQYFSTSAQRFHKGEVNPRFGVIVLSWKHFVEGYATNEGINLGLHEMAHALQLENVIMNDEFGFMEDDDIRLWQILAVQEMEKINNGSGNFFREYGGTNQAEFFSVAAENFFERPKEFLEYNKALYQTMCKLLKQYPLLLRK